MNDSELSRRRVLLLGGAGVAGVAVVGRGTVGAASAAQLTPGESGTSTRPCVLAANAVAFPYRLDAALARRDIADGTPGAPLALDLTVRCVPEDWRAVPGVAVEVWHCDALGRYAGRPETAPTTDDAGSGLRLHGFQVTDAEGRARFTTIVPGWHGDRAPHVHVRVHSGAAGEDGGYAAGALSHSGELFFEDAVIQEAHARSPYTEHTGDGPASLAEDVVYTEAGVPAGLLTVRPAPEKWLTDGYHGSLVLGITTGAATGGPPETQPETLPAPLPGTLPDRPETLPVTPETLPVDPATRSAH